MHRALSIEKKLWPQRILVSRFLGISHELDGQSDVK